MKIQNIIRMQAVVIGLGAVLCFARTAPAQEIVNTEFNDGPYVTAYDQSTTTTQATAAAPQMKMAVDPNPAVATAAPVVTGEAMDLAESTLERGLFAASLFGIVLYLAFAFSEIRRTGRNSSFRTRLSLTRRAALS